MAEYQFMKAHPAIFIFLHIYMCVCFLNDFKVAIFKAQK